MRPPSMIIMEKKKILLIISALLIITGITIIFIVTVTGNRDYGDYELDPDDTGEYTEMAIDPKTAFLTEHDWIRQGNCEEHISFTRDGGFSYWCSCGSSVDDYDLYDSFEYKDDIITLKGYDGDVTAKVVYYDNYYLCLYLDSQSQCRVFVDSDYANADYIEHEPASFVNEGWLELYILDFDGNSFTVAPYGYDRDAEKDFEEYIRIFDIADGVEFYSVTTIDDNGEVTTEHFKLNEDEIPFIGEYYTAGYVNLDTEGKVKYIVFYGKTTIQG